MQYQVYTECHLQVLSAHNRKQEANRKVSVCVCVCVRARMRVCACIYKMHYHS